MAVRLLLVGDRNLTRKGLLAVLQHESDISVIGEAKGSRDALEKTLALEPDIVLIDTAASNEDGVEAIRAIKQNCPRTRVLLLTPDSDQDHFCQAVAAGADGYELMDISPSHLANAIRAVLRGEKAINQVVVRQVVERLAGNSRAPSPPPPSLDGLTRRETEVLTRVAQGLSDKAIAARLFLSESTVKSHLRIIYTKLKIHNRAQATAFAIQQGLLAPGPRPPHSSGSPSIS